MLPISPALARLLAQIDELQPARIGELAKADHCSQPTMTIQVQRLEELGLLSRTSDPADSRAVLIALTDRGRDLLGELRAARAAALAPMLDALADPQRDQLEAAIEVLRSMLDTDESTS